MLRWDPPSSYSENGNLHMKNLADQNDIEVEVEVWEDQTSTLTSIMTTTDLRKGDAPAIRDDNVTSKLKLK